MFSFLRPKRKRRGCTAVQGLRHETLGQLGFYSYLFSLSVTNFLHGPWSFFHPFVSVDTQSEQKTDTFMISIAAVLQSQTLHSMCNTMPILRSIYYQVDLINKYWEQTYIERSWSRLMWWSSLSSFQKDLWISEKWHHWHRLNYLYRA